MPWAVDPVPNGEIRPGTKRSAPVVSVERGNPSEAAERR